VKYKSGAYEQSAEQTQGLIIECSEFSKMVINETAELQVIGSRFALKRRGDCRQKKTLCFQTQGFLSIFDETLIDMNIERHSGLNA
jgi:hypothetical protein